jgi:hypothetical protein
MDDPKHLTISWDSKSHKPKIIYPEFESALGPSTPPYPTVADWCRKF